MNLVPLAMKRNVVPFWNICFNILYLSCAYAISKSDEFVRMKPVAYLADLTLTLRETNINCLEHTIRILFTHKKCVDFPFPDTQCIVDVPPWKTP